MADANHGCNAGKVWNQRTNRCVKADGKIGRALLESTDATDARVGLDRRAKIDGPTSHDGSQQRLLRQPATPVNRRRPRYFTAAECNAHVAGTRGSSMKRGSLGAYQWNAMSLTADATLDVEKKEESDRLASLVTSALSAAIFRESEKPLFRLFTLQFYKLLVDALGRDTVGVDQTGKHRRQRHSYFGDVRVVIKGGLAYNLLTDDSLNFPSSDCDVVIYINPGLEPAVFSRIKSAVSDNVARVMSLFKRTLDSMMSGEDVRDDSFFLDPASVRLFKQVLARNLAAVDPDIMSPWTSPEMYKLCSRNSFVILGSLAHTDRIVRVELPHFQGSPNVMLAKSPWCASHNLTLQFTRDDAGLYTASFELFRLRLSLTKVEDQKVANTGFRKIIADFLDISIPDQSDTELTNFWNNREKVVLVEATKGRNTVTDVTVMLPTIEACCQDLHNMIFKYSSHANKLQKRRLKLSMLQALLSDDQEVQTKTKAKTKTKTKTKTRQRHRKP